MVLLGKNVSVSKFDGNNFLSLTWTEKNILLARREKMSVIRNEVKWMFP